MSELLQSANDNPILASYENKDNDNIIALAHKKAAEFQALIGEFETDDQEEKSDFVNELIRELDDTCGHVGSTIAITGNVIIRRADFTQYNLEDQSVPEGAVTERRDYLEDVIAQSLGYYALSQEDGSFVIRHGALSSIVPSSIDIPHSGHMFQQDYFYVPVDSAIDIQPLGFQPQDNSLEILQHYLPDLTDTIDEAVLNAGNSTQMLRKLSKVKLDALETEARDVLAESIVNYVNAISELNSVVPHQISGFRQMIVVDNERSLYGEVGSGIKITGTVEGVDISPDNQFTLNMQLPFSDNITRTVKIILNGRLFLKELNSLQVV